ncbi:1-deoxy-D-xylulose-5-phosphate synthase [Lacticaseibacillus jixiensis]|uniref:1-deoxy-D-xylulose-5-phosphate synthase n=1 Tax=Lacticaseibacillus jixiensis TaxID=3231926 RepID=UPI0036F313B9
MSILETIQQPSDLRTHSVAELTQLAEEIRQALLTKLSNTGGHVGPNLGAVELTIAWHYVFDSPHDKIVYDVSHQSYTHKILTGRKQAFLDPAHYHDVSGFTEPRESEHDFFTIGHTSTSVGLAAGLVLARDAKHSHDHITALIGDGSLSGGLAYEALDNAAVLNRQLLIIVNDNQWSIAEDHGGIYQNLKALRDSEGQAPDNLFKALGLDYRYEAQGNDIGALIKALEAVKDLDHPVVLHVNSQKGRGYAPALANEEGWHWHQPFNLADGSLKHPAQGVNYWDLIFADLDHQVQAGKPIYAMNAAIPGSFHLKNWAAKYPKRYIDVGIAEQVSITLAAGMAKGGLRPVVFHSATFLQRAYDQLSHDLGINELPVVLLINGGRISGGDPTHQADLDQAELANIPNLKYLAPSAKEDLLAQLDWALEQTSGPVAIRVPSNGVHSDPLAADFAPEQMHVLHHGSHVALMGLGSMRPLAEEVAGRLSQHGIDATVIDPRSTNTLDVAGLEQLRGLHQLVVTMEEGTLDGGFGQKIAAYFGPTDVKVLPLGAKRQFNHNETREALLTQFNLTPETATQAILDALK